MAPPAVRRLALANILHVGLRPNQDPLLPPRARWDLRVAKAKVGSRLSAVRGDVWVSISLDRDPDRKWGVSVRNDGRVETLRARHELEWALRWSGGVLHTL